MKKFVNNLYKNQALFYKVFLFALTAVLIVYLLPRGGNFKYEIPKGKPWQYENLYAPFDFAILKSEEEIQQERQQIRNNHTPYFQYNQEIPKQVKAEVPDVVYEVFPDSLLSNRRRLKHLHELGPRYLLHCCLQSAFALLRTSKRLFGLFHESRFE